MLNMNPKTKINNMYGYIKINGEWIKDTHADFSFCPSCFRFPLDGDVMVQCIVCGGLGRIPAAHNYPLGTYCISVRDGFLVDTKENLLAFEKSITKRKKQLHEILNTPNVEF